jgi:branched-chain amino acid transport system ATP-binding protein
MSAFYGDAQALHGVDLRIEDGEIVLDRVDLTHLPGHRVCDYGVAIVPEGRRVFAGMSVRDNLSIGAYRRSARAAHGDRLSLVYDLFPVLESRSGQRAGTLSGGEQQMLAIGRALMSGPRLLLLDEPSLGLAPVVVDTLFDVLQDINRAGVSMLLVEQNVTRALAISQRGYLLSDGRILRSGTGEELLQDAEVRRVCLGI